MAMLTRVKSQLNEKSDRGKLIEVNTSEKNLNDGDTKDICPQLDKDSANISNMDNDDNRVHEMVSIEITDSSDNRNDFISVDTFDAFLRRLCRIQAVH